MDIVAVVSYFIISTFWSWICNNYFIGSLWVSNKLLNFVPCTVPFKYNSPAVAFGDHFVKKKILFLVL